MAIKMTAKMATKDIRPDDAIAWVIVAASFVGNVLLGGIVWSAGVMYEPFLDAFPGTSSRISFIVSLITGVQMMTAVVSAILVNRFGEWKVITAGGLLACLGLGLSVPATHVYHLYATYGVLAGTGMGLSFVPHISMVTLHFHKRQSLAMGIAASGFGAGFLMSPLLVRYLDLHYGWRGTLLILTGITLHMPLVGLVMKQFPGIKEVNASEQKAPPSLLNIHLLKNFTLVLVCLNNFLLMFGVSMVYVHLAAYSSSLGNQRTMGNLLLSIAGLTNCVGRLILGVCGQIQAFSCLEIVAISCLAAGITIGVWTLATSYTALCIFAAIFGFFTSCWIFFPIIVANTLGKEYVPSGLSFTMISQGIGFLAGAPTAGWLYDLTHFYPASFYLASVTVSLSAAALIAPIVLDRRKHTDVNKNHQMTPSLQEKLQQEATYHKVPAIVTNIEHMELSECEA